MSLSIPDSTNSQVNVETEVGSISYTELTFRGLNQTPRTLSGIVGTGEAEITIYTKKGNIQLNGLE